MNDMIEYIELINQWILQHHDHAWWIIFLIAFSESMIVLGLIVPGLPLMLMLGGLIATGALDPWFVFFWCIVGAVVGDGLSFWIGKTYKYHALNIWPLKNHPEWISRGEYFFEKWGGVSILFGRFFGPLRSTVPVLAGILGMSQARFTFWNFWSAVIWAPSYLAPGFLLGWLANQGELGMQVAIGLVIFASVGFLIWRRYQAKQSSETST
jgi:membrane protein DedA with SNARE-associated domain